ncbi:unnamed protein product [Oppiella nova]|uniref:Uncharacterized protein n=1 Tax=Oppiella nova TaxID=334625 RepID=A0A7R9MGJ0_9ACAR|nr:unnamed protein product [Oppiella nova]CAG2176941.1 unnamed protein product [Oppiella nova]
MKAGVCKPETTDNALLGKLADCKKNFYNIPADKMAEHEAKYTEMMKDCVKDDELKAYTKVDLTNKINKFVLMSWCGEGFQKCMHEKWQKAKEAKTEEKADPDQKHHPTAEQKTTFQTCLKNAIKV